METARDLNNDTLVKYAKKGYILSFDAGDRLVSGRLTYDYNNDVFFLWDRKAGVTDVELPDDTVVDVSYKNRHICTGITSLDPENEF